MLTFFNFKVMNCFESHFLSDQMGGTWLQVPVPGVFSGGTVPCTSNYDLVFVFYPRGVFFAFWRFPEEVKLQHGQPSKMGGSKPRNDTSLFLFFFARFSGSKTLPGFCRGFCFDLISASDQTHGRCLISWESYHNWKQHFYMSVMLTQNWEGKIKNKLGIKEFS